jgi:hypothetical protein
MVQDTSLDTVILSSSPASLFYHYSTQTHVERLFALVAIACSMASDGTVARFVIDFTMSVLGGCEDDLRMNLRSLVDETAVTAI